MAEVEGSKWFKARTMRIPSAPPRNEFCLFSVDDSKESTMLVWLLGVIWLAGSVAVADVLY